jgi:hypothetical protein
VERQEHDWVKVHIMCGVKTNIVTAIEIAGRNAGAEPFIAFRTSDTGWSGGAWAKAIGFFL